MELKDPNVEISTKDSIITNPIIDNEGTESLFSDMSDEVIINTWQKPGKPKVITITDTDLSINWDVPSSDLQAVDFFEIQWKKKEEKRWFGRKNTDNNCTIIKIPVTAFEKNTAYQFKVRWTTQEGVESQFSDISDDIIIEVSQKPGKPKGVTSNDKDLLISWDVPPSDLQAVDFFEIQWKRKEEKRWSRRKNTEENCTSVTIPITDFEKNTAYQFKLRWITQEGVESQFSDISDDIIIKISQKPGKPKGVTSNEKDLLISWDVPSSDLQAVDFFEIQWKKKEEKRWSGRKNTDDNCTAIKIPIADLEKNTAYQFKVRWTTQEGEESQFSDVSDDIVIKISQKPGKPTGVTSNDKDLLISWDVPSSDLQAVDFFEIQWKKKEEKRWLRRRNTNDNCTSINIPITDLEKNTAYQFKVRWTTQEGIESPFSDVSDDIIIKMSQKPGKPKVVTTNDTYLLISWDVPSLDLQVVDFFEIQWKKKVEMRWSGRKVTSDNSTSITVPNTEFDINTAYQFKVRWTTKEGVESECSDISDDIMIRMPQKPGKPKGITSNDKYVVISWNVASSDLQAVDVFEIQWKKKDEKRWPGRKYTYDNSTSITIPITEFENNTAYQFKVRWITKDGLESTFSEISEDAIIVMIKKPDKPKVVRRNDKELVICWDVSPSDLQAIYIFEMQWKKKEENRWLGLKCTSDNSTSIAIPITEFQYNTIYQFKVKWTAKNGEESPFSDISDDILIAAPIPTRCPQQPGKVVSSQTTATSAYLEWERPKEPDEVSYYEVKYRSCGDFRWLSVNTEQPVEKLHLKNLKSENDYEFKVRAIFSGDKGGPFSELSGTVRTQQSLATRLKNTATKLSSGNPQIYKIPLIFSEETTNKTAMIRKGRFGKRDHLRPTKTIMVVGATGAGKSTLIDGMINYIVDVAWEDDFRFTIIEDEKAKTHLQDIAQTNWITCYEVNYQHGSRLYYNLNIIDTPGFGGTRDIKQDQKLREFLMAPADQGIDSIDAICFVTPAPLARLTHTQTYIFDAILSIFGKDVKCNIFALTTFADGNEPPVLAALKEANVPFQRAFNFNNSSLFACTGSSEFSQLFWNLGTKSFDNFFIELNQQEKRSLKLTSQVLALRKEIEITIERLLPQFRDCLNKMNILQQQKNILEQHKSDIKVNKDFTYIVEETCMTKVDTKPGECSINCLICNAPCRIDCRISDDDEKTIRCLMDANGNCRVCRLKCHRTKHVINTYYFEVSTHKVNKIFETMKEKYESAVAAERKQTYVVEKCTSEFKSLLQNVMPMIQLISETVNKLEQVSLKLNPLYMVDYVNLLIESEKREMNVGWEARMQVLEENKKKAVLVQKISDASVHNDWTYEDVENLLINF